MGHHHRVAAEPGGHPQAHRVDPDRHRAPASAHPDRPRPDRQRTHPHIPRTHRHAAARCPQLQAASHLVTVGVDPQQTALVQQHPDGALTDRHGRRRAGQRHPPGHRQPGGDRRVVRSHGGAGRPGHSGVASREVPPCRRPTTTKASSITTTPATSRQLRLDAFTPTPGYACDPSAEYLPRLVHCGPDARSRPARCALGTALSRLLVGIEFSPVNSAYCWH